MLGINSLFDFISASKFIVFCWCGGFRTAGFKKARIGIRATTDPYL
jgi:hypothetical protein